MSLLKLLINEIKDQFAQENFLRIVDYVRRDGFRKGQWRFVELELTAPSYPATVKKAHGLSFVPKDALTLSLSPDTATATWKYDSFDRTYVYLTISAAVTVRAYVGRYEESAP